jgi:soluble lytic murein transglycosylase-like protein
MADSSYMIAPGERDAFLRRKLAAELYQRSAQPQKIDHWTQGLAQMLNAGMSGYELHNLDKQDRENRAKDSEMWASALEGYGGAVGNAGANPMGNLPYTGQREKAAGNPVYDQGEINPMDAAVSTPQELGAGVNAPQKYAALIGKAAVDTDLPPNLIAAKLKQESGFNPGAISPAGAQGISQFMPGTAKEMGVGDPFNPEQAIPAGAQYLRKQVDKFGGSVPLGLAAYNAGPGAVSRAGGDMSRLPAETQAYVPAVMNGAGAQTAQYNPQQKAMLTKMLQSPNEATRNQAKATILQQQFKPTEYDFKERPDGSFVAINKKNPQDTRIVQPGNSQDLIDFAAKKEGATARAKQNVERDGAAEHEAGVKGAVKRAELQAAKDIAKPEQDKIKQAAGTIVTQDLDRAIDKITKSPVTTTGFVGNALSFLGGTEAHNLSKLLDTVKSNTGFQELQKMREASPTGGALGAITIEELKMLQAVAGSVEQSQDPEQLKDNLRRLKNTWNDVVHGPGKGPEREKLTFLDRPKADAAPVKVQSPDEARKLPKGTRIILPDGSPGVVP